MSLEFTLTHCSCHVTASIRKSCKKTAVACFLECVALKLIHFKCRNLTETDMKPPLTLFDVAMSKLSNDIKNSISVRCLNMTLFAWTVTYIYIYIYIYTINKINIMNKMINMLSTLRINNVMGL